MERYRHIFSLLRRRSKTVPGVILAGLLLGAAVMAADSPRPSKAASKALRQAERLASAPGKTAEALALVKEALEDSVTARSPRPYILAGRIHSDAFGESVRKLAINRNDPAVDRVAMADHLMAARSQYLKAIALDTVRDKKGNIRTPHAPELSEWILEHSPYYYNAGIDYLNKKLYYPQAYEAFITYADLSPDSADPASSVRASLPADSARAKAYYYAGVMAFNAARYSISADAFEKSRALGYPRKEVLINQMVCYRRMADSDSTLLPIAMKKITETGREGISRFGIAPPLFVQKYVAGAIWQGDNGPALALVDSLVALYPEGRTILLPLRGELHLAMADTAAAIADYRLAAFDSLATSQTLLAASRLMARKGIADLAALPSSGRAAARKKKEIKEQWLSPALQYALRAGESTRRKEGIFGELSDEALAALDRDRENTEATIRYHLVQ